MKGVIWQKVGLSRPLLFAAALLALLGLLALERFPRREPAPDFAPKYWAAERTARAFAALKRESARLGLTQEAALDPAASGLIGVLASPLTTNHGLLAAKQTSVNPNFAALVVGYLNEAQVRRGDFVAVGFSGSFPALNVAVLAALETIGAKPLVVSGVGSSQWGANRLGFSWPEMEALLYQKGLIATRSKALSRGGIEDRALGLSPADLALLDGVLAQSGLPVLQSRSAADSVARRMALYDSLAGADRIAAYINVGGGASSVGAKHAGRAFAPGLLLAPQLPAAAGDSVMARFAARGVPLIHLTRVSELAQAAGFAQKPTVVPEPGLGAIYEVRSPDRALALGIFIALVLLLLWGARRQRRALAQAAPPDPGAID